MGGDFPFNICKLYALPLETQHRIIRSYGYSTKGLTLKPFCRRVLLKIAFMNPHLSADISAQVERLYEALKATKNKEPPVNILIPKGPEMESMPPAETSPETHVTTTNLTRELKESSTRAPLPEKVKMAIHDLCTKSFFNQLAELDVTVEYKG